jgi:hypothetical protein
LQSGRTFHSPIFTARSSLRNRGLLTQR